MNPELVVYVHGRGSRHLVDPSRLLQAAAHAYGERFAAMGYMLPIPEGNLRTIDSGDTIALGATHLDVHHTPGHAKHHVIFHDPFAAAVFAGDALGSKVADHPGFILTPPGDYDKRAAIDSINLIQALKPEQINFTHCGTYCLNPRERFFEDLKQSHEQWTLCVAGILNENPEIETQALWKSFFGAATGLAALSRSAPFISFERSGYPRLLERTKYRT